MNGTETKAIHGPIPEATSNELAGSSLAEAIGAVAASILAILGLAGISSWLVASVATIVIGGAFVLTGWAAGARTQTAALPGMRAAATERGSSVSARSLGGLAGIVLGILSFFLPTFQTLLAVAVLVYGTALLLGAWMGLFPAWRIQEDIHEGPAPIAGGLVMVGVAALVLGILAIIGLSPETLILVGLLSLGVGALFASLVGRRTVTASP